MRWKIGWSNEQRLHADQAGKALLAVGADHRDAREEHFGCVDHETAKNVVWFTFLMLQGKTPAEALNTVWPTLQVLEMPVRKCPTCEAPMRFIGLAFGEPVLLCPACRPAPEREWVQDGAEMKLRPVATGKPDEIFGSDEK